MVDVWDKVAVVKRGKNRLKVFMAVRHPVMPSEIVRQLFGKFSNSRFNIVSRALTELARIGLVRVRNPGNRPGRLYELTRLGRKVQDKIREKK